MSNKEAGDSTAGERQTKTADASTSPEKPPFLRRRQYVALRVSVIVLFSVMACLHLYRYCYPGAQLEFQLLSESVVVDLEKQPDGQLHLLNGERLIDTASLVSIKVINTGSEVFSAAQKTAGADHLWSPGIVVKGDGQCRILGATIRAIGDDKSTRFEACREYDDGRHEFSILLLNEDAEAQIDVLVEGRDVADHLDVYATGKVGLKFVVVRKTAR